MIGSLESVYTQSVAGTLQVVLKALNNRKHIYVVNLSDSYAALKARERAQRETEGKKCISSHATYTKSYIQRAELIKVYSYGVWNCLRVSFRGSGERES